jgi:hypothetical protein
MSGYGQKLYPAPAVFMRDYLTAAHFNAHRAKTELDKLHKDYVTQQIERQSINNNVRSAVTEIEYPLETHKENMIHVGNFVMLAVKESKIALDNVKGIKTVDAVEIEEDIRLMKDAFENEDEYEKVNMEQLMYAKLSAADLAGRWDIYFNSRSAKGGKRTHRKRTHRKRTHRNRKRTHRHRKQRK